MVYAHGRRGEISPRDAEWPPLCAETSCRRRRAVFRRNASERNATKKKKYTYLRGEHRRSVTDDKSDLRASRDRRASNALRGQWRRAARSPVRRYRVPPGAGTRPSLGFFGRHETTTTTVSRAPRCRRPACPPRRCAVRSGCCSFRKSERFPPPATATTIVYDSTTCTGPIFSVYNITRVKRAVYSVYRGSRNQHEVRVCVMKIARTAYLHIQILRSERVSSFTPERLGFSIVLFQYNFRLLTKTFFGYTMYLYCDFREFKQCVLFYTHLNIIVHDLSCIALLNVFFFLL